MLVNSSRRGLSYSQFFEACVTRLKVYLALHTRLRFLCGLQAALLAQTSRFLEAPTFACYKVCTVST